MKRSYGDGCTASHALDLIGERWALLVVRELLNGPKRYTDLQTGLRGVSTNRLSERLRELEEINVLRRRRLPAPASAWVYELTDRGRALEPVLLALGQWGMASPTRDQHAPMSIDAQLLAVRSRFYAAREAGRVVEGTLVLHVDEDVFSVRLSRDAIDIARADTVGPQAVLETDGGTFRRLVTQEEGLGVAEADSRVKVDGDRGLLGVLIG